MQGGYLIYQCRLCGERHIPTGVPSIAMALTSALTNTPPPKEWDAQGTIGVLDLHHCSNGSIGVSDLIGAKLRTDESEES